MKFVEDFKREMCNLIRVGKELERDFIPAYKALRHGRLRVSPLKSNKIMHRAGGHAHANFWIRLIFVIMISSFVLGVSIGIATIFFYPVTALLIWIYLPILILLLLLIPVLFYQSDDYLLGYLGERAVADELEKLGRQQWRIFHNLETDKGNIDHIIVCNKGVFCVETKAPRKKPKKNEKIVFEDNKILINKIPFKRNPIKQAKKNARWLYYLINDHCYKSKEKKLGFIVPIITFPGWWVNSVFNEEVVVCNPKQISDVFKDRKDTLSEDEFNNICKLLEGKNQIDLSDVS